MYEQGLRIARHTEEKTRRRLDHNRAREYVSSLGSSSRTAMALKTMQLLRRNGVWVPRANAVDPAHHLVQIQPGGRTLSDYIASARYDRTNKTLSALLAKTFRAIGRMHQLGICHGHPHDQNVVVKGNVVGFIDFQHAKRAPNRIWTSSAEIVRFFGKDYSTLTLSFGPLIPAFLAGTPAQTRYVQRKLFERIIRQYPCSHAIKEEVLAQVLGQFK